MHTLNYNSTIYYWDNNGTGGYYSLNDGTLTTFVIEKSKPKPIFKINDFIVYLSYLKWSKKLAVHHIIDITADGYLIKSSYDSDDFIIEFDKQSDFMELAQAIEEYPELFLSITELNGPEKDLGKIIEKYKKVKHD